MAYRGEKFNRNYCSRWSNRLVREVRRRSVRRKLKAELQEVTEDVNYSPTSSPATPLPLLPLATFASPPPVLWRDLQCPGSYKKLKSPLMFSPSSSSSSSSSFFSLRKEPRFPRDEFESSEDAEEPLLPSPGGGFQPKLSKDD